MAQLHVCPAIPGAGSQVSEGVPGAVRMGELANGNLKQTAAGVRPLDAVVDGLATDVSVTYFLLPIPESDQSQR